MTRLYFVRHGQSASNAGGLTTEHATIPLTPLGLAQADALAEHLQVEPSRVLASPFTRARDTAQRFCDKIGRHAEIHYLLREFETIDPALLDGLTGEQRRPIVDAYWARADLDEQMGVRAETFAHFEGRVAAVMDELASLPDQSILFGHGMWMGLMFWKLLGFSASDSRSMKAFRRFQLGLPIPNCAVYVLETAGAGRWSWQVDESALRLVAAVRLEAAQSA